MRRPLPLLAALALLSAWSFFDPFHEHLENGNRRARAGEHDEAITAYGRAAAEKPSSPIPDFNTGLAEARRGEGEAAAEAFRRAAAAAPPDVAADALYNLGNVHLEGEQLDAAVDAYLRSLDLDPADADARRNLEIAWRELREQQQQQQQQQPQESGDEPRDEEDPRSSPPDEGEDESGAAEPPPPADGEPEESPEESAPEPPEPRFSREDAERLLNAVQSEELKVLEQLRQQEGEAGVVTRDW